MKKSTYGAVLVVVLALLGIWYWGRTTTDYPTTDVQTNTQTDAVTPTDTTTGTDTSTTAPAATATKTPAPAVVKADKNIIIVTYTDKGFSPFISEIHVGQAVRFVNQSAQALWVTGYDHNTASHLQDYPEFDEGKSISRGQTFTFNFIKKGTWGYKNLNKPEHLGAVAVTD